MTYLGNGEHMNEPGGNQRGEPVTYREYMEGQRALQTQITELRLANERFAHLPEKFDKFTETVTAELRTLRMQHPQPSQPDTTSLALHHLADAVKQIKTQPPPPQQGWKNPDMLPWLLFFGLLGAIVGDASGLLSLVG